ncbi:MAG: autotransporter domain-containing protein, partial [Planctomycetaceae bacterium]|nr:autotransporter domain-containing protein [Planctomycetaceae bacterium]
GSLLQKLLCSLAIAGTTLYGAASLNAQLTYTSNQNGNWTNSTIWSSEIGDYPSGQKADYPGQLYANDDATISHEVNLSTSIPKKLEDLPVLSNGTLNISENGSVNLFWVPNKGTINISGNGSIYSDYVENYRNINLSGNASLTTTWFENGLTYTEYYIENGYEATIDITDSAKLLITPPQEQTYMDYIPNYGTITIHDTQNSKIAAIQNYGTLTIENAVLDVAGSIGTSTGDEALNTSIVTNITNSTVNTGKGIGDQIDGELYADSGATLNITNSTINLGGTEGGITAWKVGSKVNIKNSTVSGDAKNVWLSASDGGTVTLDNSSFTGNDEDAGIYNGGTLELRNGSTINGNLFVINDVYDLGESTLENKLIVSGAGNVISGNLKKMNYYWGKEAVSEAEFPTFVIEGTDKNTDFLKITGDISTSIYAYSSDSPDLSSPSDTFNLAAKNLTVDLSANILETLADSGKVLTIGQGTSFTDVVLAGQGSEHVKFVLNEGSGIRSDSGNTFKADTVQTNNAYIYVGVDQNGDVGKIQANSIDLEGTTTVILLNTDNTATTGVTVKTDEIFDASRVTVGNETYNPDTAEKEKVSGKNEIEVTTSESNSSKIVITSATNTKDGETVNEFDLDVNSSGEIVADTHAVDTPPTPNDNDNSSGSDNAKPVSGTSNLATLKTVLTSPELHGSQLQQQIGAYAGSDSAKIDDVLAQLDPAIASVAITQTIDAVSRFIHAGSNRTFKQLDSVSRSRSYFADNNRTNGTVLGQVSDSCDPCSPCGGNFSRQLWFEGLGGWQNQSTTGVDGYTSDVGGFALGLDRNFDRNTILGVAFGGEFSSAKSKNGFNTAKADTLLVEFYGGRRLANWFVNFSGGYAGSDWKTNRTAPLINGWAKSEHNAETYFGNIELAYRIGNKNRYLTPFIAYDFVQYREDAYSETGNGIEMKFAKRTTDAYLQTLGFRAGRTIYRNGIVLTPELTAGWLHDYGAGYVHTAGSFAAGGPQFVLRGVTRNTNRAVLGLSLNAELSKQTSLTFRYDGEFAGHYNAQYLTGGINISF